MDNEQKEKNKYQFNLICFQTIFKTTHIIYYTNNEDKWIILKNGYGRRDNVGIKATKGSDVFGVGEYMKNDSL